ncbi:MAG: dTDP-4-dehydrorhamnose 3,5-epimerase [Verrucomicrobiales bacterium]|jgi:dTDP-4-dehydrorhamnose 3,5-epimerase
MPAHFTALRRIETSGGEVMKALHADEPDFNGLGEAYFSRVNPDCVRAWKRHNEMTVNVVVPVGHVRFVVVQIDSSDSANADAEALSNASFDEYNLGPEHSYGRLTVEPGTWFGFKGGIDGGLVLNLSDIVHRPDEADGKDLDDFGYDWSTTLSGLPLDNHANTKQN